MKSCSVSCLSGDVYKYGVVKIKNIDNTDTEDYMYAIYSGLSTDHILSGGRMTSVLSVFSLL